MKGWGNAPDYELQSFHIMITSISHHISTAATKRVPFTYKKSFLSYYQRPASINLRYCITYRQHSTMGEAPPPTKEHILCLLPFPERSDILDPIRKKHPNVEFNYKHVQYIRGVPQNLSVLDGTSRFSPPIEPC